MPSRTPPYDRARLVALIKSRSVETGRTFTLASGRTSDFYCNLKPTMLDPEGAFLIGALIVDALGRDPPDLVGGLELGAVPLATATSAMSFIRGVPIGAFVVRKTTKEHGTKSLIEGLRRGESLQGKRVAVLEDVTTTGGSAMKAIEAVRGEGGVVAKVVTVVDRQEGAAAAFAEMGIPFVPIVTAAELRG